MSADMISAQEAGTLYGLLRLRAECSGNALAYRQSDAADRAWQDLTWADVHARSVRFANAIAALGLTSGERIAVLLRNGVDWVCFDMAGHRLGQPVVGLYTNDMPANTAHAINDARPSLIFMDTAQRWASVASLIDDPAFIREVWIDDVQVGPLPEAGPHVARLCDVLARDVPEAPPRTVEPEATAALIYTSGTTGPPKGVMLSHGAILRNAEAVGQVVPPRADDVFLSILPLPHAFERTLGYVLPAMAGSCVAYAHSLLRLRQDLAAIRPTVIMGVPRFYEAVFQSARRAADKSHFQRALLERTARIGWAMFAARNGWGRPPGLLDRLSWPALHDMVGRRVMAAFGGRMRVAVSGGAELPPEIGRALVGLGLPLVEGYGLTEAGPVVTASRVDAYRPGSSGFALPGIGLRLSEADELLVRTPSRMTGYWDRPAATAEALDADGWLRTGDMARVDNGRVHITGRLKDILALSNGENVNPHAIETVLLGDPLFVQCCIVGDGEAFVAALVVLDREVWGSVAATEGLPADDLNAPAAHAVLLRRIKPLLQDFPAHHQIRALHADFLPWTLERGLLTPTLKPKRKNIIALYADEVGRIYRKRSGGFRAPR